MSSDTEQRYDELDVRQLDDPLAEHRRADDLLIRVTAVVVIALVVVLALAFSGTAADIIRGVRAWVNQYTTWYFVVMALLALVFCLYFAFSRFGGVRLGGPSARPQYSRFAWYSMLFACGQGVALIFWSVAEPIMIKDGGDPLTPDRSTDDGALGWSYFHWAITGWAIYCIVAVCIAYSTHNRNQKPTFRGACEDLFRDKARRPAGVVIEFIAIITTVFGLSTSFGFASLQLTSGLEAATGIESSRAVQATVIAVIGLITGVSVFYGVNKGMKRVSEANSILSILLIVVAFVFGPTVYLLHLLPQSFGEYIDRFLNMSFYTDPATAGMGDTWNGTWTVFIWCWTFAFSPFVASFIASISRGRSLREFILGVIAIPSVIVVVWIAILGGTALRYDPQTDGAISEAVNDDVSKGLFAMAEHIPLVGSFVVILATVLVATYFITSLDAGVHALSSFVTMGARPSAIFRAILVAMIVGISLNLLLIGGEEALSTIQTGTIIGALPFTIVVMILVTNLLRRLRADTARLDVALPEGPDGGQAGSVDAAEEGPGEAGSDQAGGGRDEKFAPKAKV
ncbi:MAG: BCCT family transporter [Actinomycetaceae bacterium]|nr:BCCT family transporter [Actinomycetaceae bacterium]